MQENAAASIDRGIAKTVISEKTTEKPSEEQKFVPYTAPRRRPGTGYVKQLKDDLWEGRYSPAWPDGKQHSRNVYGHTQEECEAKVFPLVFPLVDKMRRENLIQINPNICRDRYEKQRNILT